MASRSAAAKLRVVRRAPENESKHDRFRRLAPKRVRNALRCLRQIGNLSASGYESTEQERAKIVKAVSDAATAMAQKLERQGKENPDEFNL